MWVEGVPNAQGRNPHEDYLGPLTNSATSLECYSKPPPLLVPMVLPALLMERCAIEISKYGIVYIVPIDTHHDS